MLLLPRFLGFAWMDMLRGASGVAAWLIVLATQATATAAVRTLGPRPSALGPRQPIARRA